MPETYADLAARISLIRYGKPGKVLFNYAGHCIAIKEPRVIMLVGSVGAAKWIADAYGPLLAVLPVITARTRTRSAR